MDPRLDSAFGGWGHFTGAMTGSPDVPGRLSYDPVEGISLELAGSPTGGGLRAALDPECPPTLYGQLVKGTLVTLVDCHIKKAQSGPGGVGLPTLIRAMRLVVGAHVDELDHLSIKTYAIEFSSLSNWTCASPVKSETLIRGDKYLHADVSVPWPNPIEIVLPDREFDLDISHVPRLLQASGSCDVRWQALVTIAAHENMLLPDALEVARQCENLMSLLIGEHPSVKSILMEPGDTGSAGRIDSPLQLVYCQRGKHDRPDLHPSEMLLPYSAVKEEFSRVVGDWFARSEQAVLASNVFFGSELCESIAVDVRFLSATQAAESYHRSLGTGVYMKEDDYESAMADFLSRMPTVIQGDHRASLKNRLKYGNEYSLRKRLTEMLERLPQNVQAGIAGDVSRFVSKVVDTRNYFTHFEHDAQANAFEGKDILVACERLRILVLANMLHDLGIKNETLLSVLQRKQEFQHWMSQELPL